MPDSRTVLSVPKLLDLIALSSLPRMRKAIPQCSPATRGLWPICHGRVSLSPFICTSERPSRVKSALQVCLLWSLPGRLYRHGTQFDFMISFRDYKPSPKELQAFQGVLWEEVRASQKLENMIYESRRRDREHYTLLHRRLNVLDINTEARVPYIATDDPA